MECVCRRRKPRWSELHIVERVGGFSSLIGLRLCNHVMVMGKREAFRRPRTRLEVVQPRAIPNENKGLNLNAKTKKRPRILKAAE